jgi:hypothetical protein
MEQPQRNPGGDGFFESAARRPENGRFVHLVGRRSRLLTWFIGGLNYPALAPLLEKRVGSLV